MAKMDLKIMMTKYQIKKQHHINGEVTYTVFHIGEISKERHIDETDIPSYREAQKFIRNKKNKCSCKR